MVGGLRQGRRRTISLATFSERLMVGDRWTIRNRSMGERATKIGEELERDTNAMCRFEILSSGQVRASGSVEEGLS